MVMREGKAVKGKYFRRFERYPWDLWGHLSLPSGPDSRRRFIARLKDWMQELHDMEGEQELRWVITYEKGLDGSDDSVRILIGGLRDRISYWQYEWSSDPTSSRLREFTATSRREALRYVLHLEDKEGTIDIKYKL